MFREKFTADEWQTLQFGPLWAFSLIAGVDGKIDKKEVAALAKDLTEWANFKEPLTQEVLQSVAINFEKVMELYIADSRKVDAGLKEVADLLGKKATQEQADNFKKAVLLISANIADASGGVFGLGNKVTSAEAAAFALIMTTLGVQELETASAH